MAAEPSPRTATDMSTSSGTRTRRASAAKGSAASGSHDRREHFSGAEIDKCNVGMCVMSTQAFAEGAAGTWTAWETKGQVFMGRIDPTTVQLARVVGAPGDPRTRKHPSLAV